MWRDIEGHPNYEVSENGQVRRKETKKVLKQEKTNKGYFRVTLSHNGKAKRESVHRLVAKAFLEETGIVVNHKDGNKENNHYTNLEWCSQKENSLHAVKVLGIKTQGGYKRYNACINEEIAHGILEKRKQGWLQKDIAEFYSISRVNVRDFLLGKRYKENDFGISIEERQKANKSVKNIGNRTGKFKFDEEKIEQMKEDYRQGMSVLKISEKYKLSYQTARKYIREK